MPNDNPKDVWVIYIHSYRAIICQVWSEYNTQKAMNTCLITDDLWFIWVRETGDSICSSIVEDVVSATYSRIQEYEDRWYTFCKDFLSEQDMPWYGESAADERFPKSSLQSPWCNNNGIAHYFVVSPFRLHWCPSSTTRIVIIPCCQNLPRVLEFQNFLGLFRTNSNEV